jgi:hypothetical protein
MQVLFESRDPEGARLRQVAERRVRFAMRRVAWLAPRVRVHLSDINGPAGGTDKRCLLEFATAFGKPVVITALARDWRAALECALGRATRMVLRAWHRARRPGRAPHPARFLRRSLRHA